MTFHEKITFPPKIDLSSFEYKLWRPTTTFWHCKIRGLQDPYLSAGLQVQFPGCFSPIYVYRLYSTISYVINQLIEHEINKTMNWNFMFHLYHVYVTSTVPFYLKDNHYPLQLAFLLQSWIWLGWVLIGATHATGIP